MANTILITANWHTGALSQQTISRQYDNNRYVVQFVGYPEASEGNELDYYLLVWMSSAPGETPDEIAPIQLASDQWYISNVFTQQTQQIKFQMCALNTEGTFEAHSPIFTGFVRNSLDHDGTTQDIDVSTLFDAYREYLNELIIRAGAVVIDPTPTQGSTNAVQSGGVKSALDALQAQIPQIDPTLSQSGQAADSKVVGDEIGEIKEDLGEVQTNLKTSASVDWEIGNIDLNGVEQTASNRARTDGYLDLTVSVSIDASIGVYSYRFYSDSNTFTEATDWLSAPTVPENVRTNANSKKCRIVYKNNSDATASVAYVSSVVTIKKVSNPFTAINQIYTDMHYLPPVKWELGHINPSGVPVSARNRMRENEYLPFDITTKIQADSDVKYVIRTYDKNNVFVKGTGWLTGNGTIKDKYRYDQIPTGTEATYRIAVAFSNDATITDINTLASKITLTQEYSVKDTFDIVMQLYTTELANSIQMNTTGLGNVSIRCAKEQSYIDGSAPQIEFFLLEEPITHRFYFSRNLSTKEYLFTFSGESHKYSFGILQNGDIIACLDADAISTNTKDDANRQNPFVFLASENWSIQHEVDFGSSLKPCGWLENCGFKVLADGSAIFCEYTRQTTYTANAWRINGDPTNKNNWTVTQSFVITTTDNSNNFKHCHCVMQDFYTGTCYLATGDSDKGAMLFASADNGETWTQLLSPDSAEHDHETGFAGGSEKYCRMLSMTFTKDFIYWASDTAVTVNHFLFKAERNSNGVLDYSTVQEVVNIPMANYAATYGTAYLPEFNAILLLERTDSAEQEMPVRLITLSDGILHTIGKMEVCPNLANTGANLGFRTRFSEWYPRNGLVRVGYDLIMQTHNNAVNQNKGFDNEGHTSVGGGSQNINNLCIQVYKNGNDFGFVMETKYV